MRILVTGGCGFIGSALVLHLVQDLGHEVATLDALTYAANPISLQPLANDPRHRLVEADICDPAAVHALYAEFRPEAVMHLAAESHVDRSITDPGAFIRTNVVGTQVMLDGARTYSRGRPRRGFASSTSPPTRSTAPCRRMRSSPRRAATTRARPIRPRRRPPTTWPVPGTRPTACRS
jgi:dTDP-glucose 4,6-dehydratase